MSDDGAIFPEIAESTQSVLDHYTDRFEAVSESALQIFRVNLLIIALFLPLVFTLFNFSSGVGDQAIGNTSVALLSNRILNKSLTQVGLFFWAISMTTSIATQYYAKKGAISQYSPYEEFLNDKDTSIFYQNLTDTIQDYSRKIEHASLALSGCFLFSFLSIIFLSIGFITPFTAIELTTAIIGIVLLILSSSIIGIVYFGMLRVGLSQDAFLAGIDFIFGHFLSQTIGYRIYTANWESLTPQRRSLLLAIAEEMDSEEFTRTDLEKALKNSYSSSSTPLGASATLLNRLAKDNYLTKTRSSKSVLIHDSEAAEDELQVAQNSEELEQLVEQVEQRENITVELDSIHWKNMAEVTSSVNQKLGRQVLTIVAEPNKYSLTENALRIIKPFL